MRVELIVNRRSRLGARLGPAVRAALLGAGIEIVDARADAIVCAGGDGTLLASVEASLARGVPLGVVPLGTFNELARTLGIPLDIEGAVAVIAKGATRAVDVGRVNGTHYLNEASIGISSRIARMQTPELKQRFGIIGVIATVFSTMRHARPMRVDVRYDGKRERLHTIQLTVANSHRFGGFLNVADAAIDDGQLDLYSVDIHGLRELLSVGRAMLSGKPHDIAGLRTLRSTRFELTTRRPHRITADGEPAGRTPAVFEILPKALRVFAPAGLG